MSKTTFEKLGIPYAKRNGIFYPVLVAGTEESMGACGLSM